MKQMHKPDWKLDLLWFSYGYQKCMLVDRGTNFPCYVVLASLDLHTTGRAAKKSTMNRMQKPDWKSEPL